MRAFVKAAIVLHFFLLGFFAHWLFITIPSPLQQPLSQGSMGTQELHSPYDWIDEKDISLSNSQVCVKVDQPILAAFENTNSMDPLIDSTANAIEIIPKNPEEIHVGDIVSYKSGSNVIIHRVTEIGSDDQGWFARFKGDNNPGEDPNKVRFPDIQRVALMIVY
ncbi:MAG: hypothetical protein V1735_04595 [Nanoarchaeota archaeon]